MCQPANKKNEHQFPLIRCAHTGTKGHQTRVSRTEEDRLCLSVDHLAGRFITIHSPVIWFSEMNKKAHVCCLFEIEENTRRIINKPFCSVSSFSGSPSLIWCFRIHLWIIELGTDSCDSVWCVWVVLLLFFVLLLFLLRVRGLLTLAAPQIKRRCAFIGINWIWRVREPYFFVNKQMHATIFL